MTQSIASGERDLGDASPGSRVRVAIVAASPRWVGGQSVQADALVRWWQQDPEADVRFVAVDPRLPSGLGWAERIPGLRTVLRMPFYGRDLWRAGKEVEILHIFSASYWSFLLAPAPAWLLARACGRKVLINYHSGEAKDHLAHSRTALRVLKRVDAVVVPSSYLADVFREFGVHASIVPNAVDLSQFRYRARKPLRPLIVCTRGFHRYYSVDLVVRAFAEVKREFPEARLCLAGKGELEEPIKELVRQLKLQDVEFTGAIAHEDIHRYYEQADIFVNASWLDNMPISILEAFASGLPVVSTAPEGIARVVQDERTGLLCAPQDWRGLAVNVMRLLRDPELAANLAANAYQECQKYTWDAVRPQWLEVYRSLQ